MSPELVKYLLDFHDDRLTPEDIRVLRATRFAEKVQADASMSDGLRRALERLGDLNDPAIEGAIAGGVGAVRALLAQKIWADRGPTGVVLNLCPRCGGLARTPRARQCQHCNHSWHEAESEGPVLSQGALGVWNWAAVAQPWQGLGQDRWRIFGTHEGLGVVLADGAGNSHAGEEAADLVVEQVAAHLSAAPGRADEWSVQECLLRIDEVVLSTGGETTALAAVLTEVGIVAAAAGDTAMCVRTKTDQHAWFPRPRTRYRLGSGCADVNVFRLDGVEAALFVTDGALNSLGSYRTEQVLSRWHRDRDASNFAKELAEVRSNVGDDVTLVGVLRNHAQ